MICIISKLIDQKKNYPCHGQNIINLSPRTLKGKILIIKSSNQSEMSLSTTYHNQSCYLYKAGGERSFKKITYHADFWPNFTDLAISIFFTKLFQDLDYFCKAKKFSASKKRYR